MAQIFHHSTNTLARVVIFRRGLHSGIVGVGGPPSWTGPIYATRAMQARNNLSRQPCHHVAVWAWIAGIATPRWRLRVRQHSSDQDLHDCIRRSGSRARCWSRCAPVSRTGASIPLERVHDSADFVYFITASTSQGNGCETCHGGWTMPLTWQQNSLQMGRCRIVTAIRKST